MSLKKYKIKKGNVQPRIIKKFIKKELKRRGLKRIGKCNHCGKCCELGFKASVGFKKKGIISDIKYEGCENVVCDYFDKKTRTCKIHKYNHKMKNWFCTEFPLLPEFLESVKDVCGYKFVKVK